MSEKRKQDVQAAKTFAYRGIKKEFTKFQDYSLITPNAHLELGENNEAVVVEDRPDDWFEIAQKDADKVGLANILELARRRGENPFDGRYAFKNEEALDLGDLDPNDPESVKAAIGLGKEATEKLEATAKQLGVSVDELVDAFVKGSLNALIESKSQSQPKDEEGGTE